MRYLSFSLSPRVFQEIFGYYIYIYMAVIMRAENARTPKKAEREKQESPDADQVRLDKDFFVKVFSL